MKNEFQAVVFDLDGTLVDTEVVWHEAEDQLVRARGHVYTLDAREHLIGMRIDDGLTRLKQHYGFTDSVPDLIDELNRNLMTLLDQQGVRTIPGVEKVIDWVVEQKLPRAIASAAPDFLIEDIVHRLGWDEIFKIRCSCDYEANGKPAPDVYLTAARRLGIAPERCLALEDTINGARAAVAAGMTCYAVPDHKYSDPTLMLQVTPHVFRSMDEVLEALR
jgi:HAD superfamily hydrolase (TIGR01509 family)